jgi:GGDEF domain-containing protein
MAASFGASEAQGPLPYKAFYEMSTLSKLRAGEVLLDVYMDVEGFGSFNDSINMVKADQLLDTLSQLGNEKLEQLFKLKGLEKGRHFYIEVFKKGPSFVFQVALTEEGKKKVDLAGLKDVHKQFFTEMKSVKDMAKPIQEHHLSIKSGNKDVLWSKWSEKIRLARRDWFVNSQNVELSHFVYELNRSEYADLLGKGADVCSVELEGQKTRYFINLATTARQTKTGKMPGIFVRTDTVLYEPGIVDRLAPGRLSVFVRAGVAYFQDFITNKKSKHETPEILNSETIKLQEQKYKSVLKNAVGEDLVKAWEQGKLNPKVLDESLRSFENEPELLQKAITSTPDQLQVYCDQNKVSLSKQQALKNINKLIWSDGRGFANQHALEAEMALQLAGGKKVGLAVFDLKGFGAFRHTYGLLGERMADTLAGFIRNAQMELEIEFPNMKLYSRGGDEFFVVFPDGQAEQAQAYIEKLQKKVNSASLEFKAKRVYFEELLKSFEEELATFKKNNPNAKSNPMLENRIGVLKNLLQGDSGSEITIKNILKMPRVHGKTGEVIAGIDFHSEGHIKVDNPKLSYLMDKFSKQVPANKPTAVAESLSPKNESPMLGASEKPVEVVVDVPGKGKSPVKVSIFKMEAGKALKTCLVASFVIETASGTVKYLIDLEKSEKGEISKEELSKRVQETWINGGVSVVGGSSLWAGASGVLAELFGIAAAGVTNTIVAVGLIPYLIEGAVVKGVEWYEVNYSETRRISLDDLKKGTAAVPYNVSTEAMPIAAFEIFSSLSQSNKDPLFGLDWEKSKLSLEDHEALDKLILGHKLIKFMSILNQKPLTKEIVEQAREALKKDPVLNIAFRFILDEKLSGANTNKKKGLIDQERAKKFESKLEIGK